MLADAGSTPTPSWNLVEDVRGKGHLSKSIGGQMRHSIFVPVE